MATPHQRGAEIILRQREKESVFAPVSGFPTSDELLRLSHVVRLTELTAVALGYRRFRLVFSQCVAAAVRIAPLDFRHNALFEAGERAGYEFRFATALAALRFRLAYDAALRVQP